MEYNENGIPKRIKENHKMPAKIQADDFVGDAAKRKCIHATLDQDKKLTAIVIGLNPSTANLDRSDRTFTKVGRYLSQYDVKDFYMLNLYETVSPDPNDIKECEITDWEQHRPLFEAADLIQVAWGIEPVHLTAKKKAADYLGIYRKKVFCVRNDKNNKGVHPRKMKYSSELTYFFDQPHYPTLTLCGSTRFRNAFYEAQKRLTLKGYIVISVGLFGHDGDTEVWESMDEGTLTKTKEMLDDMHKRKIDMADGIYVINVGGYIEDNTASEIRYAMEHGKKIMYLEPEHDS